MCDPVGGKKKGEKNSLKKEIKKVHKIFFLSAPEYFGGDLSLHTSGERG